MRIAMIGQKGIPATWGGIERHVEELSTRLVALGHDVVVYTRPNYTDRSLTEHQGVQLRSLPTIGTKHLDAIVHCGLSSLTMDCGPRTTDFFSFCYGFLPRILSDHEPIPGWLPPGKAPRGRSQNAPGVSPYRVRHKSAAGTRQPGQQRHIPGQRTWGALGCRGTRAQRGG